MEQSEAMKAESQIHMDLIHFPFPLQSPGQMLSFKRSGMTMPLSTLLSSVRLLTAVTLHSVAIEFIADNVATFTSSKI